MTRPVTAAGATAVSAPVPVREDLGRLSGYHSPQVDVQVRLNTNESPLPPPPGWTEALQKAVAEIPFNRYPDRQANRLRAALADHHGVTVDEVFCANGSNEVLQCLLLAYGGPGRTSVAFEPTYALHSHIARLTGTGVVQGNRAADFTVDPRELRRVLGEAEATVTFFCSPNNPTGTLEPYANVEAALALSGGLVVVDEAYGPFSGRSAVALRDGPYGDRLVVVTSFSKTWSLAGLRLGYAIATPAVVEALESVALPYHVDAFTQEAGRVALGFAGEVQERVQSIVQDRERMQQRLARLPVDQWPSQANFVLFRPLHKDGHEVWQQLVERSVLVRDTSGWPGLEGCLRVTVGSPEENDRFVSALEEVLR
ncbi:MAG: histidinol-phosphate transaminase [Actinomycetota bacterium]|nr:histidinol-phosphate transaminase [Actinomycetota bacterium]